MSGKKQSKSSEHWNAEMQREKEMDENKIYSSQSQAKGPANAEAAPETSGANQDASAGQEGATGYNHPDDVARLAAEREYPYSGSGGKGKGKKREK
jgi:hypothetical protein